MRFIYNNGELHIYVEENLNDWEVQKYKEKLFFLIEEYAINSLVIEELSKRNNAFLEAFIKEYKNEYKGEVKRKKCSYKE